MNGVTPSPQLVNFKCPSGHTGQMTREHFIELDGEDQLNDTRFLDAPVLSTQLCPDCVEETERRDRINEEMLGEYEAFQIKAEREQDLCPVCLRPGAGYGSANCCSQRCSDLEMAAGDEAANNRHL